MNLSLIVVTVFGHVTSVTPVPLDMVQCIAVLPVERAAIAARIAPHGLDMAAVRVVCAPPGAVVLRGGDA